MQVTSNFYRYTWQIILSSAIATLQTLTHQSVNHLDRLISQIYCRLACPEAMRTYRTLGHLLVLGYLLLIYGGVLMREPGHFVCSLKLTRYPHSIMLTFHNQLVELEILYHHLQLIRR